MVILDWRGGLRQTVTGGSNDVQ